MRYLFDADVLINAKNFHYNPAFCPEFWDWIVSGHNVGLLFGIDKVRDELLNGNRDDPLYAWARSEALGEFFLNSKSATARWAQLSQWANDPKRGYFEAAKAKFLDDESADAWLVALAAHEGDFQIISNEASRPEEKRDIKLPDAAAALGVKTIALHEVLAAHVLPGFKFKP